MSDPLPNSILQALELSHTSWRPVLIQGLEAVHREDPAYLSALAASPYLPTEGRLFAAFALPLDAVRYVLVGEGPYPREASATGVCFMDGAVESLWSDKGLSKQVNRATSLRNFMKMLLVADGVLDVSRASGDALVPISVKAHAIGSPFIQTLAQLQANFTRHGFLLLNASLVYRGDVAPQKDAKAWRPFLQRVLSVLLERAEQQRAPRLVLWGKIAEQLSCLAEVEEFPKAVAEHPYNLSFIGNQAMHRLFEPMRLLYRQG